MLSKPDGFVLCGKLRNDFLSSYELLISNLKDRLRLILARLKFDMINDNPNVGLGTVDCSLYTPPIALKDDYHRKRLDMLAYNPVDFH